MIALYRISRKFGLEFTLEVGSLEVLLYSKNVSEMTAQIMRKTMLLTIPNIAWRIWIPSQHTISVK